MNTLHGATLFVSFFGARSRTPNSRTSRIDQLNSRFYWALTAPIQASPTPDEWHDVTETVFGLRFDPPSPAAHDTSVLQVALNAQGDVVDAWSRMLQVLEKVVTVQDLLHEDVWGYSLVFQCVSSSVIPQEEALAPLFRSLRSLHSARSGLAALVRAEPRGGQLWLLEVPLHETAGPDAMIYAAISLTHQEEKFQTEVLLGKGSSLIMTDAIAHKSYYFRRQYSTDDIYGRYDDAVKVLWQATDNLLEDLGSGSLADSTISDLSVTYNGVARAVPRLNQLLIELQAQKHNLSKWLPFSTIGQIDEYHLSHLEAGTVELNLMLSRGKGVLDAASDATTLAELRQDQIHEYRQQWSQTVLALIATALAVPALVDREATENFLNWTGLVATEGNLSFGQIFWIHFGIVAICVTAIYLVIQLGRSRSTKSKN